MTPKTSGYLKYQTEALPYARRRINDIRDALQALGGPAKSPALAQFLRDFRTGTLAACRERRLRWNAAALAQKALQRRIVTAAERSAA